MDVRRGFSVILALKAGLILSWKSLHVNSDHRAVHKCRLSTPFNSLIV